MKFLELSCLVGLVGLFGCGGTVVDGSGGASTSGSTSSGKSSTVTGTTKASVGTDVGGSTGSGGVCTPGCGPGFSCCNGACVNTANDPHNCGDCNIQCAAPTNLCAGSCVAPPCTVNCGPNCCGQECCSGNQICCEVQMGGPTTGPKCTAPELGTCPVGCPTCQG